MNIPCKDCLTLGICKNKRVIKCGPFAEYLGGEYKAEHYREFDKLFKNSIITGITGDVVYAYDVSESKLFSKKWLKEWIRKHGDTL